MARRAPHVLLASAQMLLQFQVCLESQQARKADELVPGRIVILEVVLQGPVVLECTQAQIAEDFMALRILDVIA